MAKEPIKIKTPTGPNPGTKGVEKPSRPVVVPTKK
jgi:hypothetical protein